MQDWGDIQIDKRKYKPLEKVFISIKGRETFKEKVCRVRILDSEGTEYENHLVELINNQAILSIIAGGNLGVHTIFADFGDKGIHDRVCNFILEGETEINTGNNKYDKLFDVTKEAMSLNIREYDIKGRKIRGYITSDSWNLFGIWLRDMVWQSKAYKYWESDMTSALDFFFTHQKDDGSYYDSVNKKGDLHRMPVEADLEYIIILGTYWAWQSTGNDQWMESHLENMGKGLRYSMSDPMRWNSQHQLVKRPHTCDTWDFNIGESSQMSNFVIANCDQSGFYLACKLLSKMYRHSEKEKKAKEWEEIANKFYEKANELLWDGTKYLHHYHIDKIDHKGFDESQQLSMGNVWAMVRGLADHQKVIKIIQEYKEREFKTKDTYPWWSLQPGYPDDLQYYKGPYLKQGGYANGGLMPWVGGELCKASFENGYEDYAVKLYDDYYNMLINSNYQVYTWYWPDGKPGFRTSNTTPHCGWGMAEWFRAIQEGLAGIESMGKCFEEVKVSPRWVATEERKIYAASKFGASKGYFVYRYSLDKIQGRINIDYTGSGSMVYFHIMLPNKTKAFQVKRDKRNVEFNNVSVEKISYVDFNSSINGINYIEIKYK